MISWEEFLVLSNTYIPDAVAVIDDFFQEAITGVEVATLGAELDSATTTTATLVNILADVPTGIVVLKIESELMLGRIAGGTLTLIGGARPTFGTSAVTHSITTPVLLATLSDVIGSRVYHMLGSGFSNDKPGVIYTPLPGGFNDVTGVQSPRVSVKIYGGINLSQKHPKLYARIVNSLWIERARASIQKRYISGMIGSVRVDGSGQELLDESSGIPAQPFVLSFAVFNIL